MMPPLPSEFVVTSPYGMREGSMHWGTDFGAGSAALNGNAPVYAVQGGTVVYAGAASGFGGPSPRGWVVVDHPTEDGSGTTVYGHVIAEVSVGQRVEEGQRIARINPDPYSNGGTPSNPMTPHLHFEYHPTVWRYRSALDPIPWLQAGYARTEAILGDQRVWDDIYLQLMGPEQ